MDLNKLEDGINQDILDRKIDFATAGLHSPIVPLFYLRHSSFFEPLNFPIDSLINFDGSVLSTISFRLW